MKRAILISIISMGILYGGAAIGHADSEAARSLLLDGLYQESALGDLDGALVQYRRVLQEHAAVIEVAAEAQFRVGRCLEMKGDLDEAEEAYRRVRKNYPTVSPFPDQADERLAELTERRRRDALEGKLKELRDRLRDARWRDKVNVIAELARRGDPDFLPLLHELTSDEDVRVKVEAIRAIGKIGDLSSLPLITSFLLHPRTEVQVEARRVYEGLTGQLASRPAGELLRAIGNPHLRSQILGALGSRALKDLVPHLRDPNPEIRYAVVDILGGRDPRNATPHLKRALGDKVPEIRIAAARFLHTFGDSSALSVLQGAFRSKNPEVRALAAASLAAVGDEVGREHILSSLGDRDEGVRRRVRDALVKVFGENLGFDPAAPFSERSESLSRWRTRLTE